MTHYDILVKYIFDLFREEIANLALGTQNATVMERLNTEQPTFKMHHNDITLKVQLPEGEVALLHIEVQTDDSREKPMPLRVLAYTSFLMHQHELPVYSIVFYLRPPAGANDPGHLRYEYGEAFGIELTYKVIRLYDLEGESVLSAESLGLLPFTPLMNPPAGTSPKDWVSECVSAAASAPVDRTTRATLLFAMSVFGSFVHPNELFKELIREEIMRESPFYQEVIQLGIEQGRTEGIEQGRTEGIEQGRTEGIEQGRTEGIEQGIEQGRTEGIEQGRTEGIEQGETRAKQDALLKLLDSHFDVVPEARIRQIETTGSVARLDSLFEQALTAKTLDDIDWENS